jgi:hypothetical protein
MNGIGHSDRAACRIWPLRRLLPIFLVCCCTVAPAERLLAQTVHGRLLEVRFDQPIVSGTVFLVDGNGQRVASATSGRSGRFTLETRRTGVFFLGAERLGYETLMDGPLELSRDAVAEVELRLPRVPIVLDPVTGRAERRVPHLATNGFYERRMQGQGTFISRQTIEERNPFQIQQLLRPIPGVRVLQTEMGGDAPAVMMGRAAGFGIDPERPPCFADVFVDGVPDDQGLRINPINIEAVEVFRGPGEIPAQYGGMTACGVILIWLRR